MTIQCPNCKGYKTNTDRAMALALGAGMFIVGGCLSFLIFPIAIAIIGLVIMIVAACKKAKRFTCKTCGYNGTI